MKQQIAVTENSEAGKYVFPGDWEHSRLKYLVDAERPITYGIVQCGPHEEAGVLYIRPVDMTDEGGVDPIRLQRTTTEIASAYRRSIVKSQDIVISIGPSFGKVMIVPEELTGANLTQGTARVAPSHVAYGRYLFWLLRSQFARNQWYSRSAGATFAALTLDSLANTICPIPPLTVQRRIGAFLDQETTKIDALIAKQTEFLMRLDEHRRALINEAVTCGLDRTQSLQQTGINTFPVIPRHWTVKPLMRLTPDDRQIMYGIVLPGPDVPEGVPIVKGGDVKPGGLTLARLKKTTREIEGGYARSRLVAGDLVYAIRGSIGAVEVVPTEIKGANLTQDAARVAPSRTVSARWLLYVLRSLAVFSQLEAGSLGAAVRGINIRDLKRARIPVPPLSEQEAIARYLDLHLAKIEVVAATSVRLIEQLRERRSALITAAVTGQIDVTEPALTEAAA